MHLILKSQFYTFLEKNGIYSNAEKKLNNSNIATIISLGLAPLLFLSVRSWTITFLFILIGLSAWQLINLKITQLKIQSQSGYWVIAALASPLIAVIAGEIFRGNLKLSLLDGPTRPFLAVLLFVYLLREKIDFVRLMEWCIPISLLSLGGLLIVHPYGWADLGGRFSTTAIDPIALGQYATFMAFTCLLTFNIYGNDSTPLKFTKISGFIIGFWISIGSGTRSAWIAVPFLLLLLLVGRLRIRKLKNTPLIALTFLILGVLLYKISPMVSDRVHLAFNDYSEYFRGINYDTSVGVRLSLLRVAAHLFLENPLSGYGDGNYPPLSSLPFAASFNTNLLENTLIHNGVHNEIMQNTLRSGIFGLTSSILMFGVPTIIFLRNIDSKISSKRAASLVGMCYIMSMFIFGLNIELFNMKYSISFYALMISALAAQVLRPQTV